MVNWGFAGGSVLKNPPLKQETWVWSLSQEDSLEKEMVNPLQYSCLENPLDRGAWWAIVHRVAKSRTRLSDFHSLAQEIFNQGDESFVH